jgi:hypothetical protein
MALASVDPRFAAIRVDEESKQGSVIDVILIICDCDQAYASRILSRMDEEFMTKCHKLRINGKGRLTPVADAKTLIQIVWALPGKKARSFRVECVETDDETYFTAFSPSHEFAVFIKCVYSNKVSMYAPPS